MAIAPLYPQLNLDLLIAGVLFHDSGKLWENHLPETGFTMGYDERGELMGHISIGIELVNSLWRKLQTEENSRRLELAHAVLRRCSDAFVASDRRASRRTAVWFAGQPENAGSDGAQLHR